MVFYEHYLLVGHRMSRVQLKGLLTDCSKLVTQNNTGYVLRIRDLGWRRTAYRIGKPKDGLYHYGRWFYLAYGCPTDTVPKVEAFVQNSPFVLRSSIIQMKPKTMMTPSL